MASPSAYRMVSVNIRKEVRIAEACKRRQRDVHKRAGCQHGFITFMIKADLDELICVRSLAEARQRVWVADSYVVEHKG